MRVPGQMFRRLIPAAAVAAVLAASMMVPVSTLASSTNNCGVKGYGYHDHGKVCPNRPFPGKGVGLAKFGVLSVTQSGKAAVKSAAITLTTTKADAKASKKSTASAAGANRGNS